MNVIDLCKLGAITSEGDLYLAKCIAKACCSYRIKQTLSLRAVDDFKWESKKLDIYVLDGLMPKSWARAQRFVSSGEWLCGVFSSGSLLSVEHMSILMSFVNPYISDQMILSKQYKTGGKAWETAPSPIKEIFNLLDDGITNRQPVYVRIPNVVPIDPHQSIESIEYLGPNEFHKYAKIVWPQDDQL